MDWTRAVGSLDFIRLPHSPDEDQNFEEDDDNEDFYGDETEAEDDVQQGVGSHMVTCERITNREFFLFP